MAINRKPAQGVYNIVRFNWHFYVASFVMVGVACAAGWYVIAVPILLATMLSLFASFYIYDLSGLYQLNWVDNNGGDVLVNIHAGFDETSLILADKFRDAKLQIIDFYDPQLHTEVSIRRARKAYPVLPQTIKAATTSLPVADAVADKVFVIFSAHEVRDIQERATFIRELARIVKPGGEIYITEHLRDTANFMVYNIGFFHFYTRRSWLALFNNADLSVKEERKLTPFISNFILIRK